MKTIESVRALEELGRVRLSPNYFMRDFLYSEISNYSGIPNIPDNPDLAIEVGERLCEELLEPLREMFGHVAIRSAYRSCEVNEYGNKNKLSCASNEKNFARHIWDRLDKNGKKGATACVVIPWFYDNFSSDGDWCKLAWWIHDNLNYSSMYFFPKYFAFNLRWSEDPERSIHSYVVPKGKLTDKGMENNKSDHSSYYLDLLNAINTETVLRKH